jgi:uncharacterized RDD family membrane protein YckC
MTTGDYDPKTYGDPNAQRDPNAYGPPGGYPPPPPSGQPGSYPPPPSGYPPPPPGQPGGYAPPPPPPGPAGGYPPPPGGYPPPPQYGQQPGYGGFPPPVPTGPEGAGVWIRFAARFIDGILTGIVVLLISLPFYGNDSYGILASVVGGLLPFAYFVGFEVSQGWTPAKKMLGLSVRGPGGAPKPTAQQSAIRNAFMLLSVIPFVGWLLGLIADIIIAVTINNSPTHQGKHDELAGGTQVVKG